MRYHPLSTLQSPPLGSAYLQIVAIGLKVIIYLILTCFEVCNELLVNRILLEVLLLVLNQL